MNLGKKSKKNLENYLFINTNVNCWFVNNFYKFKIKKNIVHYEYRK